MTWTYTLSSLQTSTLFQTRFLIGDTIQADPQLQDEEVNFALATRGSIWAAAATCCLSISSQLSRKADTQQGDLRNLLSARAKAYALRAQEYEAKAVALSGAMPYAGGISIQDKNNQVLDPDRVPPNFNIGMDDDYLPVSPVGNENNSELTDGDNFL